MKTFRFAPSEVRPLVVIGAFLVVAGSFVALVRPDFEALVSPAENTFFQTKGGAARDSRYRTVATDAGTAEFLSGANAQIGVTVSYDPSYQKLDFPLGDVPKEEGVCSDVVVRAYRAIGVDLQAEVNADMKTNFSKYPTKYGLSAPDPNIDHRRVPNLMTYFDRKGRSKPITKNPADYLPGDIVAWKFPRNQTHIGIVSEISDAATGIPYIYSNSGRGTLKEDILFGYEIIGHYGWR